MCLKGDFEKLVDIVDIVDMVNDVLYVSISGVFTFNDFDLSLSPVR